jgi:hypothetical protein
MITTPVDTWYAVEASPLGGLTLTPVKEMMVRNQRQFLDDDWNAEVDYRPLWMFRSLEQAETFRREAVAERRRRREVREEGTKGTEGTEKGVDRVDRVDQVD